MSASAPPDAPKSRTASEAIAGLRGAGTAPLHPVLFAAAYVVGEFGLTHVHSADLLRPLVVAGAGVALLLVMGSVALRNSGRAGLLVTALLVLLIGLGALLPLVAWWLIAYRISPKLRLPPPPGIVDATRSLNVLAAIWLGVALVAAVPQFIRSPTALDPPFELDPAEAADRPDIFVLLLDGYARTDTLAEMGYDNEPFLQALEDRGFDVFRDATGSYEYTVQVLTSMLHGRHLVDLPISAPPESTVDQHRLLMSMLADAPVLDELRGLGYEVVVSRSHASHVTIWSADRILDNGALTDFEHRLLHDTELDRAISVVAPTFMWDAYRDRVASQFEHVKALAREESAGPRFAFIHAITPHPPFTFNADGSPAPPLDCFPVECEAGWIPEGELEDAQWISRYVAQLTHVNRLTLDALDALLEDPDSIVIVMSDHGARLDQDDHSEWYRTLFAARTPGHEGAFAAAPHPTAIFATIARAYFGADVDLPTTTRYAMVDDNRLRLRPVRP